MILLAIFLALLLVPASVVAQTQISVGISESESGTVKATPFGPGSQGFLATCSSTMAVTNNLLQSQSAPTAPWAATGTGAVAPTITANAAVAPDSTTTASSVVLPAVSGAGNSSFLYQPVSLLEGYPETMTLWVKGASGGEHIWISASLDATGNPGTWIETSVVATTSWQKFTLPGIYPGGVGQISGNFTVFFEIGIDLRDSAQSAQSAQTVYIWGGQIVESRLENKQTYIPTTTAAVTQNQTINCPSGVAFRDWSSLTAYASNPIIPQNTGTYNAGGVSNPYMTFGNVSSTLYGLANCTVSGANRATWPNQCLYTGTDALHWTDDSAVNPEITTTATHWDDHYMLHGSLLHGGPAATWAYYVSAMDASGNSCIGLFTSSNTTPTGFAEWTTNSPLICGGTSFPTASLPTVIYDGATVTMYTATNNNSGTFNGRWTATDGIHFTFQGTALPAALGTDWDAAGDGWIDPMVFKNKHGFYEMVYTQEQATPSAHQDLGYAVSADGVLWFKYQAASILTHTAACTVAPIAGAAYIGDGTMYEDGTHFYLLGNCDDGVSNSVGLAFTLPDY